MEHTPRYDGSQGYILKAGEGVSDAGDAVKASRISTGGNLTLIESHTTGGAPRHVHSREVEYFYVLEGTITVGCGDEEFEAGPRSFVFLPRGVPHEWNVKGESATLLIITAPAGLEEFLDEYHSAASGDARNQVAAKYGIKWV